MKGVKTDTPIYRLPEPFDVVHHIPPEEFHLLKEGLGKLLIKRMLEDSTAEDARTLFKAWNSEYQATAVFHETPRCSRTIATGQLKGSELGVLIFSAFPSLLKLMDDCVGPKW